MGVTEEGNLYRPGWLRQAPAGQLEGGGIGATTTISAPTSRRSCGGTPLNSKRLVFNQKSRQDVDWVISILKDRTTAELLYFWAGVAVPIITAVIVGLTKRQVRLIADQAQATLLMSLVDKWNSEEMVAARRLLLNNLDAARKGCFTENPMKSDAENMQLLKEHFNSTVKEMSK